MTSIIRNIFHFRCYRTVEAAALLRLVEPKIASASAQRPTSPIGIQVDLSVVMCLVISGLYEKERYRFEDSDKSATPSNVNKAPDCLVLA